MEAKGSRTLGQLCEDPSPTQASAQIEVTSDLTSEFSARNIHQEQNQQTGASAFEKPEAELLRGRLCFLELLPQTDTLKSHICRWKVPISLKPKEMHVITCPHEQSMRDVIASR